MHNAIVGVRMTLLVPRKRFNMKKNRSVISVFPKSMAFAAGCCFLWAGASLASDQTARAQPPKMASTSGPTIAHPKAEPPQDDFAGLTYTPEQKAKIDQIQSETKAHKAAVAKDEKLSGDQKEAMILGYTRMEYGQIYKLLTPEQQKQVRAKIGARKMADEAAKKKKLGPGRK